jgi:hypothetical protein
MDKGIEAIREAVRRAPLTKPEGLRPEWQAYFDAVTPLHVAELIAALDQAQQRNGQLSAERDALRESGLNGQANTRAAADIYFQLIEECDIQPGGSLVEHIDGMRDRIAELEAAPNGMMQLSNELAEMKRSKLVVKLPALTRHNPAFNKGVSDSAKAIIAAGGTVEGE